MFFLAQISCISALGCERYRLWMCGSSVWHFCFYFKYDKVNHYRISDSTRKAIKRRDATIDDDALELLLKRVDDSLEKVANEVEKLCLYSRKNQL